MRINDYEFVGGSIINPGGVRDIPFSRAKDRIETECHQHLILKECRGCETADPREISGIRSLVWPGHLVECVDISPGYLLNRAKEGNLATSPTPTRQMILRLTVEELDVIGGIFEERVETEALKAKRIDNLEILLISTAIALKPEHAKGEGRNHDDRDDHKAIVF